MKKPYNLEARDVTLNLVKDRYGPNEKQGQDLSKLDQVLYRLSNKILLSEFQKEFLFK